MFYESCPLCERFFRSFNVSAVSPSRRGRFVGRGDRMPSHAAVCLTRAAGWVMQMSASYLVGYGILFQVWMHFALALLCAKGVFTWIMLSLIPSGFTL